MGKDVHAIDCTWQKNLILLTTCNFDMQAKSVTKGVLTILSHCRALTNRNLGLPIFACSVPV